MARQTNTLPAVHAIDLPEVYLQLLSPPTGRIKENPSLPLPVYRKRCNYFKNVISRRCRLRGIISYLIPMVVLLLCLFILWWFSHAVSLENEENGKILVAGEEDHMMEEPVNVTITSTTSTPIGSIHPEFEEKWQSRTYER